LEIRVSVHSRHHWPTLPISQAPDYMRSTGKRAAPASAPASGIAFDQVLAASLSVNAGSARPSQGPASTSSRTSAGPLSPAVNAALTQAMAAEGVPECWRSGLQYIILHESSGRVGIRNPGHSDRGLFQLTAPNYHLNPHGAASFGNAVEEAQGGIRYIKQRYGTAENAMAFWQQHHWF
jgi:hypothetical protein